MADQTHLRVGLVLDDGLDKPDGVQQYILGVGKWLASQGHDVQYLVGQTGRKDIANVHSLSRNIRVQSNGNSMTIPLPTRTSTLRRLLDDQQLDILHVQTPYSPFMGGKLIRLAKSTTAVVGTFHIAPNSPLISFGNRLLGLWCFRTLKRFDTMLSVSKAAADFARATFHIESDILPNVIDYNLFAGAEPLDTYNDDVFTMLFLGRLVPRKGCQTLLRALHLVLKKDPDLKVRLVICGSGPLEAKLKRDAHRYGLDDYVEFAGFVPEDIKPRYYASSDLTIFPSSGGESFGIVLLEAMASGKAAVLAGNNPGYASVMSPRPEMLFNPNDEQELAELIAKYMKDAQLRTEAAEWGHAYSRQFDINTVGPQLVDVYNKALRKRRG
jgi:phosphatidylinositol alpha-mannosyltransferase